MPLAPDWRKTFPFEETNKVVTFLKDTWADLVGRNMPDFHADKHEPHLTKFLASVLKRTKRTVGLSGEFLMEDMDAEPDLKTGELHKPRRTDIRYFSDRIDIDLTFEFKKLSRGADSRRHYYGENGMYRFVVGYYAREKHLAVMVGLLKVNDPDVILRLKQALSKNGVAAYLHVVRDSAGNVFREPSRELPSVVQFDTEHARSTTSKLAEIVLCHLFLHH